MALTSDLLGKTLSFETNAPAILGAAYTAVKFVSILDPDTAKLFSDITAQHRSVYPQLVDKTGIPDDPLGYSYGKFLDANGATVILGLPWIKDSSVKVVTNTYLLIRINGAGTQDLEPIKQALTANGYRDYTVEVKS